MSSAKNGSRRARTSADSFGTYGRLAASEPADERPAGPAPHLRRCELPGPGPRPDQPAERRRAPPGLGEARDCCRGGSSRPGPARSRGTRRCGRRSPGGRRRCCGSAGAPPVPVDEAEQVGQLLAVTAELGVAPERRPALGDPLVLQGVRRLEVRYRLQTVGPQVHPVAVGAVDRVAHDGDQLGVGEAFGDPSLGGAVPQVERRALPADPCERGRPRRGVRRRRAATPTPAGSACHRARASVAAGRRRTSSTSVPWGST